MKLDDKTAESAEQDDTALLRPVFYTIPRSNIQS